MQHNSTQFDQTNIQIHHKEIYTNTQQSNNSFPDETFYLFNIKKCFLNIIKQASPCMTSTWRSKINACNIIQRNLIRQIYKYTIKKYIQIHNKECTEISPRDSCFAQWGSSDESRDHCAAKIQHIDIPRQYESQLRQQIKLR